ncbi:MAG: M1 family metallopeptidase [Thermoplasmataceae archaeon]
MAPKPSKYILNMDFSRGEDQFYGTETIALKCDSNEILLNSRGITINSVKVNKLDTKFELDSEKETLRISGLKEGDNNVEISFQRPFSDSLSGAYLAGKEEKRIITTQFESHGASLMFPCFDRPDMKAVFEITTKVLSSKEAISNMPVESMETDGNTTTVKFLPTPIMSTYLLYIAVGKFQKKTMKYGDVEIILAIPGNEMNSNDYPLEIAHKSLEFYEKYFGIPFELPKVHLIAVPDFAAGAMENWGAITFREEALVCNENTDLESRINIAVTIAHEFAHQWFGNLVTMKWWNDLWLNESFATFMEMLCLNTIHPEFEVIKSTYISQTVSSMTSDSLRSTHPINAKVESPNDIEQIFDEISYGKGGSILRMIHSYVGDEDFRKGVSDYLKKFKYGNAEGSYLWNSLGKASGMPVGEIMSDWINLAGLPAIRVSSYGGKLKLEQRRYFLNDQSSDTIWRIPLTIKGKSGERKILMDARSLEIEKGDYIKLNSDGTGFFRVLYEDEFYNSLDENMQYFTDIDRAEIANDINSLLISGHLTVDKYFKVINLLIMGATTPIITLVQRSLENAMLVLYDRDRFRKQSLDVFRSILKELGEKREGEETLKSITRVKIRESLAIFDPEYSRNNAFKFGEYFNTPPEDRMALALSKSLNSDSIDELRETYVKASDDTDKNKLVVAMGWMRGKNNHKALMKMVMKSEIKAQDSPWAIITLVRNPDSRKYVLSIFKYIINAVRKSFAGTGLPSMAFQVSLPYLGLIDERKARKLATTLNGSDVSNGVSKGLEMLDINLNFRKYN